MSTTENKHSVCENGDGRTLEMKGCYVQKVLHLFTHFS